MCIGSSGGGDGGAARQAELQRQTNIGVGRGQIADIFDNQFGDDYYAGRRQSYLDYAKPQLNDQYADARKQLTYSLDRNGTLDSTARTTKEAELTKEYDKNQRAVNDQGLAYENDARSKVADARTSLMQMLSATGDTSGAVNSANSRAAALTQPEAYSPLGQLFANFTGALGTQAALERNAAAGGGAPRFNTGMFGAPNSSVKVI